LGSDVTSRPSCTAIAERISAWGRSTADASKTTASGGIFACDDSPNAGDAAASTATESEAVTESHAARLDRIPLIPSDTRIVRRDSSFAVPDEKQ
jgi:hypothetical protein